MARASREVSAAAAKAPASRRGGMGLIFSTREETVPPVLEGRLAAPILVSGNPTIHRKGSMEGRREGERLGPTSRLRREARPATRASPAD